MVLFGPLNLNWGGSCGFLAYFSGTALPRVPTGGFRNEKKEHNPPLVHSEYEVPKDPPQKRRKTPQCYFGSAGVGLDSAFLLVDGAGRGRLSTSSLVLVFRCLVFAQYYS